jgi:hypothetical protein
VATIHKDRDEECCGLGMLRFSVLTPSRLVILNRMGSSIQLNVSEQSSDCRENKRCAKRLQITAAPPNLAAGWISSSCGLHIAGLDGTVAKPL